LGEELEGHVAKSVLPAIKEEADERIHSAIGTTTPADCLAGLSEVSEKNPTESWKRLANCVKRSGLQRNKLPSGLKAITTRILHEG
jgi:hypothetical protein